MAEVAAPTNRLVSVVRAVLGALIEGLGVEAAVDAATVQMPLLGLPIIRDLFRFAVSKFAGMIDGEIQIRVANIIISIQNDARKSEYDKALEPIAKGNPTPEELQAARDAAIAIIRRSR